jgi:UDP-N-acetylglucosamine 2-epimerase (non-hydrolysing)
MKQKWILAVGARPNFMKVAPILKELKNYTDFISPTLVHTGQHYTPNMSEDIFNDLDIQQPDINLNTGSGTHAEQTGRILMEFEKVLESQKPDLVLTFGDTNSTLACALATSKLNITLAHIEAGLRSFDKTMPEEQNRILTDHISDFLFTPEPDAIDNLKNEGIPKSKIFHSGDTMADNLLQMLPKTKHSTILQTLNLQPKHYHLVTLHRPSNTDDPAALDTLTKTLSTLAKTTRVIFPKHPRTTINSNNITIISPLRYTDFLTLIIHSKSTITDSGGIQVECSILDVPCITLRTTTERPLTLQHTNILQPPKTNTTLILKTINNHHPPKTHQKPFEWQGKASKSIIHTLLIKGTLK